MKRIVFKIVFLFIVLIPLWSFLIWWFWPSTNFNGLVIDKNPRTISNQSQASHWIFNNQKVKKIDGESYSPDGEDLTGLSDIKNYSQEKIDSVAKELEMIYYVEVSGSAPMEMLLDSIVFDTLYGLQESSALGQKEIQLLEGMKKNGKLVLAEYNALLNPTNLESKERLEEIFQLNFTGWVGKYFRNLSSTNSEIPEWIKERYEAFTQQEYAFPETEGVILCHQNGKVLVLELDESLVNALPTIHSDSENMERYELPNFVSYPFWFDINAAVNEEDVISSFKLQTNKKGDSILSHHGIANKFPAIIGPREGSFNYYFCGDFADNPVLEKLSYFKGIEFISRLLYVVGDESDRKAFFWNFYRPLMTNILKDYHDPSRLEESVDSIGQEDMLSDDSSMIDSTVVKTDNKESAFEIDSNSAEPETISQPTVIMSSHSEGWRIVIASLKSKEGTERYLRKLNNPEISAVWVDFLETNRICFGPFSDLGEAHNKYQEVLRTYPEAWMIKF